MLSAVLLACVACRDGREEAELHARLSALEREAEGVRATVARLERGEPILPEDAVVLAVSEEVIERFLAAQLPFTAEAGGFSVELTRGEVRFRGSPSVHLAGSLRMPDRPELAGEVHAQGGLEDLVVKPTGTLEARVVIDHLDLVHLGGLEGLIPGGSLNELARALRQQLEPRLPVIQIPVRIEPEIVLPHVTSGPVRIQGARLPLEVSVAQVLAANGSLWVAVRVVPGEMSKLDPPAPIDASRGGRVDARDGAGR